MLSASRRPWHLAGGLAADHLIGSAAGQCRGAGSATVIRRRALEAERSKVILERARTEVAATRALANAARIMADHPGLLQLRMVQSATGGAKVVVTMEGSATGER